jgi:hypothetical protein
VIVVKDDPEHFGKKESGRVNRVSQTDIVVLILILKGPRREERTEAALGCRT